MHGALTRHSEADRLIEEVRELRREQRVTNRWYAVATALLVIVVGLAAWAIWRT
jgi:hypothetical protein